MNRWKQNMFNEINISQTIPRCSVKFCFKRKWTFTTFPEKLFSQFLLPYNHWRHRISSQEEISWLFRTSSQIFVICLLLLTKVVDTLLRQANLEQLCSSLLPRHRKLEYHILLTGPVTTFIGYTWFGCSLQWNSNETSSNTENTYSSLKPLAFSSEELFSVSTHSANFEGL